MFRKSSILFAALILMLSVSSTFGQTEKKEYEALKTRIIQSIDPDETIDLILQAMPIKPDDEPESEIAALYIKLGGAYYTKKNFAKAIDSFSKAQEIEPTNIVAKRNLVNTYVQIGNEHVRMKNYDLALDNFEKAQAINPEDLQLPGRMAQAYYNFGVQLYRQRNHLEAEKKFRQCTEINAGHKAAWYMLSLTYKALENIEAANEAAIKATEADPKYDRAWKQLALNYEAQKDYEKGISAYEKYLELKPADAVMKLNLALLRADSGDLDGAVTELEDLIEQFPSNAGAIYQLGDLLQNAEKYAAAYRWFKKIENDDQYGDNAKKWIQYLDQRMSELGIDVPE